ncbi:hypothetical protein CC78DRAFT_530252 [Lojkania enalia]|uniref:Nucleoporin NSP1 n=1 Tax=Lojkania enalia TaxID=147567 RepID=A0A9P4N3E0_9PLEO|nr:hypothetical protein CC78DRAFT_530252 [Didymosphaeria enalia]
MSFNFSAGGNSTPGKNPLFGASSTSGSTTPSFHGVAANNTSTGSKTPGTSSLFGAGNAGGPSPFGTAASSGGTSGSPSLFGGSSTPASSNPGGVFGGATATSGASQPASTGFSFRGLGGGSSTPAKPSGFGAAAPEFQFGTASSLATSTPAQPKTTSLPSTTPAGPPPGGSLFGSQASQAGAGVQQPSSSLFTLEPTTSSTSRGPNLFTPAASSSMQAKPIGSAPGNSTVFSGFGNKTPQADTNKLTPAQQPTTSGLNPFSNTNQPASSGPQPTQVATNASLFSTSSTTPASSTPTSKPPAFGLGGTSATTQSASSQAAPTSAASASPFNLGNFGANMSTPASTTAPASNMSGDTTSGTAGSSAGSGSGLFGTGSGLFNLPKPVSTAASSAPAPATSTIASAGTAPTATPAPSLFSNLGTGTSATTAAATSGAATTGTSGPSLFSTSTQPSTSTAATDSAATNAAPATSGMAIGDTSKGIAGGLAGSTAGPPPSSLSRLKNKTMDEIITRWAADLSKYQKEFQSHAEQVALWDRALVENSDKVKGLYAKTFQAERDAAEVERQLRIVEENQQELESYLDRYEKEVENQLKLHGVGGQGRSDGLRGPDQDRERTYKLAEKLQDRLNELNKDLTEMIEEINTTSQTLSKTGKPDDPLTKVVRVLNSQLSQLQQIENGTSQLQAKINSAQKESQRVGASGWNGLGTDPTEDFYRSFRGGRTDRFGGVS